MKEWTDGQGQAWQLTLDVATLFAIRDHQPEKLVVINRLLSGQNPTVDDLLDLVLLGRELINAGRNQRLTDGEWKAMIAAGAGDSLLGVVAEEFRNFGQRLGLAEPTPTTT